MVDQCALDTPAVPAPPPRASLPTPDDWLALWARLPDRTSALLTLFAWLAQDAGLPPPG